MRRVSDILSVVCGYAAAVIGAGFASGQEILCFFVKYGRCGIIGIFVSCIIFSVFAYAVLSVCVTYKVHGYDEYLKKCFSGAGGHIIKCITLIFAVASICVMAACSGELIFSLVGAARGFGALIFVILCGLIFFLGDRRVMKINSSLGAVIVTGMIFCCLFLLRFREHQVFFSGASSAVSGASYAGYNLLTAAAVLCGNCGRLKNDKEAAIAAAASGFVMLILISLVWMLLGTYYGKINLGEIPMLTLMLRYGKTLGAVYGILLFLAALTTGISNGFGVINLAGDILGKRITVLLILLTALCMSGNGFSNLVNTVYRICGYAGMAVVVCMVLKKIKKIE